MSSHDRPCWYKVASNSYEASLPLWHAWSYEAASSKHDMAYVPPPPALCGWVGVEFKFKEYSWNPIVIPVAQMCPKCAAAASGLPFSRSGGTGSESPTWFTPEQRPTDRRFAELKAPGVFVEIERRDATLFVVAAGKLVREDVEWLRARLDEWLALQPAKARP